MYIPEGYYLTSEMAQKLGIHQANFSMMYKKLTEDVDYIKQGAYVFLRPECKHIPIKMRERLVALRDNNELTVITKNFFPYIHFCYLLGITDANYNEYVKWDTTIIGGKVFVVIPEHLKDIFYNYTVGSRLVGQTEGTLIQRISCTKELVYY